MHCENVTHTHTLTLKNKGQRNVSGDNQTAEINSATSVLGNTVLG